MYVLTAVSRCIRSYSRTSCTSSCLADEVEGFCSLWMNAYHSPLKQIEDTPHCFHLGSQEKTGAR